MNVPPSRSSADPVALDDRARDNLRFIRHTMERGIAFTAVPGWGGVAMGGLALLAAILAGSLATLEEWLVTWLLAAGCAVTVGGVAMARKASRADLPLLSGTGRRFLLSFLPAAFAGAILTLVLFPMADRSLLAGLWLLLYGAAVVSAGTYSVQAVPFMGLAFMVLGAFALVGPAAWGTPFMALGFGGLHILFGIHIGRTHGG